MLTKKDHKDCIAQDMARFNHMNTLDEKTWNGSTILSFYVYSFHPPLTLGVAKITQTQ
jgi:hypothetical protein